MRDAGHRTPDIGQRTSDNGHRTSDGGKSKNNISTPQGGGHKYSKCNNFQVISDLLNSDNLKVAITQLCHELQV